MATTDVALYCTACGQQNDFSWSADYPLPDLICRQCSRGMSDPWLYLLNLVGQSRPTGWVCPCGMFMLVGHRFCFRCGYSVKELWAEEKRRGEEVGRYVPPADIPSTVPRPAAPGAALKPEARGYSDSAPTLWHCRCGLSNTLETAVCPGCGRRREID